MVAPVIIGDATLYHGDCLEILPTLPKVDAVITDPPYGMGWDGRIKSGANGHAAGEPRRPKVAIVGDDEPFNPAPWLDFPSVVLWGSNHFARALPVGSTLVWIKKLPHAFCNGWLSDAEVAWEKGGVGVFCHSDTSQHAIANERVHPTQKPVSVMHWCLKRNDGETVLDPFMGSGTTGVACAQLGRKFIGIEIERKYFDIACERIDNAYRQARMFA